MHGHTTRRRVLAGVGGVCGSVSLAGCSSFTDGESGLRVAGLVVYNELGAQHSVRVEVNRNGGLVFEETLQLADGERAVRDGDWPSDPAEYETLSVILGSNTEADIVTFSTPEPAGDWETDCYVLSLVVTDTAPYSTSLHARPAGHYALGCD